MNICFWLTVEQFRLPFHRKQCQELHICMYYPTCHLRDLNTQAACIQTWQDAPVASPMAIMYFCRWTRHKRVPIHDALSIPRATEASPPVPVITVPVVCCHCTMEAILPGRDIFGRPSGRRQVSIRDRTALTVQPCWLAGSMSAYNTEQKVCAHVCMHVHVLT